MAKIRTCTAVPTEHVFMFVLDRDNVTIKPGQQGSSHLLQQGVVVRHSLRSWLAHGT